jgi:hypothetical protein
MAISPREWTESLTSARIICILNGPGRGITAPRKRKLDCSGSSLFGPQFDIPAKQAGIKFMVAWRHYFLGGSIIATRACCSFTLHCPDPVGQTICLVLNGYVIEVMSRRGHSGSTGAGCRTASPFGLDREDEIGTTCLDIGKGSKSKRRMMKTEKRFVVLV